ncbi:hypothetical protein CCR75_008989 [Bremia lactucae]|uniref:Uncharacterized protein n=1 Tax=Bremia lactucae TaxID=4779 RepID=A0A976IDW7_BRELC|nr:hypothetical protein CCR75_008989 [Bremia lactucae]
MLAALTDRIQALETSQMQIDENERLREAIDSELFHVSDLGRGMGYTPYSDTFCRAAQARCCLPPCRRTAV